MRFKQWAICGDSASVRWMVVPSSWTIRLTSSLLAGSALSIARDPRKLWRHLRGRVKGAGLRSVEARASPGGGPHDLSELRRLHRLGQVDLVSGGEDPGGVVTRRKAGERRRRDLAAPLGTERADLADERVAVLAGHPDVAHEHVGLLALHRRHRFPDRREGGHVRP